VRPGYRRRLLAWTDDVQRRHGFLAFPYAVLRKYEDDEGGRHAALIAYYGFLSVFPLLLLGVAVVSRALVRNAELRQRLVEAMVPPTLRSTVDSSLASLPTSRPAFVAGLVGLLLSATGVVYSADRTVNHIAAVPWRARIGVVGRLLRAVGTVAVLLVGVIAVGGLTVAVAAFPGLPVTGRLTGALGSAVVVFAVLLVCGRLLLDRPVRTWALFPAAALGTAAVTALLLTGARLLPALVAGAGPVYGGFATVAGIFTLLSLISRALVYAGEVAAVRHARLWPRSLDRDRPTDADVRAFHLLCREQERTPALLPGPPDDPADHAGVPGHHLPDNCRGEHGERQYVQPADVGERQADRPVPLDADVHGVRQRERRGGPDHVHDEPEQAAARNE
jgi:membrane protein